MSSEAWAITALAMIIWILGKPISDAAGTRNVQFGMLLDKVDKIAVRLNAIEEHLSRPFKSEPD